MGLGVARAWLENIGFFLEIENEGFHSYSSTLAMI